MEHFYPQSNQNYVEFFRSVVDSSALLVAKWMAVGFAHGVLNTDNMSLLSITIDFGPFGFLDSYEPNFIPNHSDDEGRYSYSNQPAVFKWNMARLADALSPLTSEQDQQAIKAILDDFHLIYERHFVAAFRRKLGLKSNAQAPKSGDQEQKQILLLLEMLFEMMTNQRADFTQTFRQLASIDLKETSDFSAHWALNSLSKHRNFDAFLDLYRELIRDANVSEEERQSTMNSCNPQYVLFN